MKLNELRNREDLGAYLEHHYPSGFGAEIGVQHGLFSYDLLKDWKSGSLFSVDMWKNIEGYIDSANVSDEEQENIYGIARDKLHVFGGRSSILRQDSVEAAENFDDEQLDFVYLDADHSYEGCTRDIEAWYPKVKPGGLIAGHDFLDGVRSEGNFGVESAVRDFFKEKFPKVVRIKCPTGPWDTWAIIK